jgi:hypothetical protein
MRILKTRFIQDDLDYPGVRVNLKALLERARISLQVDIGFGDAITPAPERLVFPALLDTAGTVIMAYPRYTAMAEKFLAIARLGIDNSRMKDFYDMVVLFRLFDFDASLLALAIQNTCRARKYKISEDIPVALTRKFCEDPAKSDLWKAFTKRAGLTVAVGDLEAVIEELRKHLLPVLEKIHRKQP